MKKKILVFVHRLVTKHYLHLNTNEIENWMLKRKKAVSLGRFGDKILAY